MPAEEARVGRDRRGRVGRRAAGPSRRPGRRRSAHPSIAADSGLDHALALGLEVTSRSATSTRSSPEAVAAAEAAGSARRAASAEKDATDLELALDAAAALEPERILVVAGARRPARPPARRAAAARLGPLRGARRSTRSSATRASTSSAASARSTERPASSSRCSPLHGPAEGVTTDGLAYPLRGETLDAGLEPRRLERLRRRDGARRASSAACCSRSARETESHVKSGDLRASRSALALALARLRRERRDAHRGRARHARLVRDLDDGEAGVRARERPDAADPARRRRGRDRQPRAADRGQPAGRRALRRRQQPPLARARRATVRAVRVAGARRRSTRRSSSIRSTASTPIDHGDVCLNVDKRVVRRARPRAAAESRRLTLPALPRTCSSSRTPRRRRPGSRSCSRRSRSSATTAGRTTGASCARTACSSSTAGRRRTRAVLRRGGQQGDAADRRLLRVEPAGRGDLRRSRGRPTAPTGVVEDELLPPGRVRRRPRGREERGRARAS